ncbi:hypothetical protein APH_0466 [Anaplasma phagocytophilum str. HZ]|uniref:Uncharacterized protein n=1 Tax=Anaplasma phagocytophilum (strain HZ) TaxID=212042 RepID=Q2GKN4_ANAPZ|nr:hypothetical protein APH_0466 [Anaplasma phagocytophilum str. HZ]
MVKIKILEEACCNNTHTILVVGSRASTLPHGIYNSYTLSYAQKLLTKQRSFLPLPSQPIQKTAMCVTFPLSS